ncbi:hypothetical protein CEP53_000458 [Fusarium sp. AF-6]|nr:hypothetical protein CEP53_000458 [Fusarium sp. AF-6]
MSAQNGHEGVSEESPMNYGTQSAPYRKAELPNLTAYFVGRKAELQEIDDNLKVGEIVVLTGIASIGKSQAARKFCDQFLCKKPDVRIFWLHFDTVESCEVSFRRVARELRIPGVDEHAATDMKPHVKDWLSKPENHGTWLLVLDNADREDVFRATGNYIPSEHGRVLVTSQSAEHPDLLRTKKPHKIKIEPLEKEDARALFLSVMSKDSTMDIPVPEDLLEVLERLPLGIIQAAMYLREGKMTVDKYTRAMRDGNQFSEWMSAYPFTDGEAHALRSLGLALKMQFDRLLEESEQTHDQGQVKVIPMLAQIGCLGSQSISGQLLLPTEGSSGYFSSSKALETLRAQGLVNDTRTGAFTMQRTVQLILQTWLRLDKNKVHLRRGFGRAVTELAKWFPKGEFRQWADCETGYLHGQALLGFKRAYKPEGRDNAGDSDEDAFFQVVGLNASREFAMVLYKMARYKWRQGDYGPATSHSDMAYDIQSDRGGNEGNSAALDTKILQGQILHHRGRYDDAKKKFDGVIKTLKQGSRGQDKDRARQMIKVERRLALTLVALKKLREAKGLLTKAAAQLKNEVGKKNVAKVLRIEDDLACILLDMGKPKKAEEELRHVLEQQRNVLGAPDSDAKTRSAAQEEYQEHPATLTTMVHLAEALAAQGRHDEAVTELQSVLASYERRHRKEGRATGDPDSLICVNVLGGVFKYQKKYGEAEKMFSRALKSFEDGVGAVDNDLSEQRIATAINLAVVLNIQGKTKELRSRLAYMADLVGSMEEKDSLDGAARLYFLTLRLCMCSVERQDLNTAERWAPLRNLPSNHWERGKKLGAVRLWLIWYIFSLLRLLGVIRLPSSKDGR